MSLFTTVLSAVLLSTTIPLQEEGGQSQAVQTQEPAVLGDVEITGQRLQQQVQSFIHDATAAPRGRNLARWDRSICMGVANFDARYAQFMIDRVAKVATEIGLSIDEPGCKPDIMVVAAADASALARALVADDPRGFRPARNLTDLGSAALERFQSTDAPVRWWHVSLPVSVDTGDIAVRLDGEEAQQIAVRDPSRIRSNVRDDLARVVVIIDVTKVGRIGFGALSDYIAMVALAQIEPDADTSTFNSVLNLFSDQSDRNTGLTQWDMDYLKSLYTARRDRARATQQGRDIVQGMTGERDTRLREEDQ
ncbi:hypothetical protein [Brevundimonas sp.]|uniref:hypothetical protein n=1 Tax=Brevundimonas sp. TaxID=1871086 RepID=UPI001ACC7C2D|nr:hypothetical protein [Brevundimonas sp.]MBN9464164.1 hypothetical protein [Brevundimonas sp.]